jgi:hypothetical protein
MLSKFLKMSLKLTKRNLFLLILVILILSYLGIGIGMREYFETQKEHTSVETDTSDIGIESALPKGIPKSEIPPGDEDLYILKSEVVPPVCPKCPDLSIDIKKLMHEKKCPPCPPCARCPEPAFECKKVPNYERTGDDYLLPRPVLADFSQFGM